LLGWFFQSGGRRRRRSEARKVTIAIALTDDLTSAAVHGCGLVLALAFAGVLFRRTTLPLARLAVAALGAAWLVLYLSSIGYHLMRAEQGRSQIVLALDDGAIFVAIAGTYTPVAVLALPPSARRPLLVLIWAVAAAGVVAGFVAASTDAVYLYQPSVLAICAAFGWAPAIAYCRTLARRVSPPAGTCIALSGVVYVGGAWFYRAYALPWHHTYWHIAVVVGCLLDFTAIASLLRSAERLVAAPIAGPQRCRGRTLRGHMGGPISPGRS
jgi:hemolysin III